MRAIKYADADFYLREHADIVLAEFTNFYGDDDLEAREFSPDELTILVAENTDDIAVAFHGEYSGAEWDVIAPPPYDSYDVAEHAVFTREAVTRCLGTERVAFSYDDPKEERLYDFWAPHGDECSACSACNSSNE